MNKAFIGLKCLNEDYESLSLNKSQLEKLYIQDSRDGKSKYIMDLDPKGTTVKDIIALKYWMADELHFTTFPVLEERCLLEGDEDNDYLTVHYRDGDTVYKHTVNYGTAYFIGPSSQARARYKYFKDHYNNSDWFLMYDSENPTWKDVTSILVTRNQITYFNNNSFKLDSFDIASTKVLNKLNKTLTVKL